MDKRHTLSRPRAVLLLLGTTALLMTASSAQAADTTPAAAAPAPDRLAPARVLIQQERWRDAIVLLQQLGDSGSAIEPLVAVIRPTRNGTPPPFG